MKEMYKMIGHMAVMLLLAITSIFGIFGCTNQEKPDMPVVLLTDFGSEDYRVPQLKGIIYTNNPGVSLIDASHDVPAFDIATGAYILDIAAREFPENVVFVGIIAPYAQTETKYLVLTTNKNQFFILPDNGLLTYVTRDMGAKTVHRITNQELFDKPIAELAAERIQGKAGALIASGYHPQDVGIQMADFKTLDIQEPAVTAQSLLGTVVYVDHFGNCITNISGETAGELGLQPGEPIRVKSQGGTIPAKFGTIYSDVPEGEDIVFVNDNLGVIQLSINLGSFASAYDVQAGTKIEIEK